jgi:hypothetical protein
MAYVPEKDVKDGKELWDEMGDNKNWSEFKDAPHKHPEVEVF